MTEYVGDFGFYVTGREADDLETHLDQVLDFLHDDQRITDPDYTASLAHQSVRFTLYTSAGSDADAFAIMHTALRAAIHAAEGCTQGWEANFREFESRVRRQLVDA